MTHKVGIKGQVVIPKAIRDEIGIKPGDEVTFEPNGPDVGYAGSRMIRAARGGHQGSARHLGRTPGGGTEELLEERRREREMEERKAQKVGRWSFSIAGRCWHT